MSKVLSEDDDAFYLFFSERIKGQERVDYQGTATVWLTTTEMGFSLIEKPNEIECTKNVRDGKVSDRYLALVISRFAIEILANVATESDPWISKPKM